MLLDIILSVMPLHQIFMDRTFAFPMGKALGILVHLLSETSKTGFGDTSVHSVVSDFADSKPRRRQEP